jgi:hypothetical protein
MHQETKYSSKLDPDYHNFNYFILLARTEEIYIDQEMH